MKTKLPLEKSTNRSSVSETGHYKNVTNLNALKVFAEGLGSDYAPQKVILTLSELTALVTEATNLHDDVRNQINSTALAVDQRQLVYENVKPLSTKVINTMGSTNVLAKTIEDAKSINAKIQGTRIKMKAKSDNPEEQTPGNSVSRQSYDSIYENFKSLNNLVQQDGNYIPTETDVNIAGLTAKETAMFTANQDIASQTNNLSNKRIVRNNRFYVGDESLIAVARGVKKYIRGKYGVTSPQFAQIRSLLFKDLGIK